MITQNPTLSAIYAQLMPDSVRLLPEDLALHHFREMHPSDVMYTGDRVITETFEDQNLLYLDRTFIEEAVEATSGVAYHYFNGLLFAQFAIRDAVNNILDNSAPGCTENRAAVEIASQKLEAICKDRYKIVYNTRFFPPLAFDFAMLEFASYLLLHINPDLGKMWVNRLYHL